MNHLIIGMGQIGTAIHGLFPEAQTLDVAHSIIELPVDVMHICFPYTPDFRDQVYNYASMYEPAHVIIYTTVPIGTTARIVKAVHSPIEGRHPDLELSVRQAPRWLGGADAAELQFFKNLFWDIGIRSKLVNNPNFTEFLKLRSTAKYGINLVWTDYEATVAEQLEMPFDYLKEFDQDYNKLYKNLGADWAQRYILDPPQGTIGGHCVVPNAKLLNEQYPSDLLKMIEVMA